LDAVVLDEESNETEIKSLVTHSVGQEVPSQRKKIYLAHAMPTYFHIFNCYSQKCIVYVKVCICGVFVRYFVSVIKKC